MPVELSIRGANELSDLAARLKAAGDRDLRRELFRGLNRAMKPAKAAVKASALEELPHAGGLNEVIASARIATRTRTSGRNPGVNLTGAKSGHDLRAIDLGTVRHPVFGRWVPNLPPQQITPGWWSRTLADQAPLVRRELVQAIDLVARKVARV